jgi:hypothetical protein
MRLALAALVFCAACSRDKDKSRPTPDRGSAVAVRADAAVGRTLDSMFLATLARVTKRAVEGGEIKSGTHVIKLATVLENDVPRPGGHAVGVAVDVVVDGKSVGSLRTGSVGIGRSRDEALATAASEWVAEFGVPIVGAFDGTPPSFESNGLKVYAGLVGFRGTAPANVDLAKPSFVALAPTVSTVVGQVPGMHALTVNVFRKPDSVNAEVRFDGEAHAALATEARKATWPEGEYMLKLFYVVMR